jgi:serine protease Do
MNGERSSIMRTTLRKLVTAWLLLVGAGVIVWGVTGHDFNWSLVAERRAQATPPVVVNEAPLTRSTHLTTSYAPIVKRVAPSVVYVYSTKTVRNPHYQMAPFFNDPFFQQFFGRRLEPLPRTEKQRSLGSGVIVTKDGYILTNDHVVDGADEIKVRLPQDKEEYTAKVIATDKPTDIAVLKIKAADLPFATLGDSDKLEVGDVVMAVGNPFGVGQTVTMGIISALGRGGMGIEDYENFIQTDAAINPGNSGGALVDTEGRVIGINTAIISRSGGYQGIGFAIPIDLARNVMNQLIKSGRVERGFLGVGPKDLTPELARAFNAPNTQGALVREVEPNSAAAKAGLQPGDVIVAINNKPVLDARHLRLTVGEMAPGTKIELKFLRDGKAQTAEATLKEMPEQELASSNTGNSTQRQDNGALNGVEVGDIDTAARSQYHLPSDLQGAMIVSVDPNSASYDAGLREGDVIVSINHQAVRNADQAVDICNHIQSKRVLVRFWSPTINQYDFVVVDESKSR